MEAVEIKHPEWLDIQTPTKVSHGYDQEWYTQEWQRLAGCGPTTATQVLTYLGLRDGMYDRANATSQAGALSRMEEVWEYVKPRYGGGVYKTAWLEEGMQHFIDDKGWNYDVRMINVSPFRSSRDDVSVVAEFIRDGLHQDIPVAFLNRHKGHEEALWTWHWVPVWGIFSQGDEIRCRIFDEGEIRDFSLTNWMKDTILGGGFAYVVNKVEYMI